MTAREIFPWRRPRRELLTLVLICFACLTPIYRVSSQDISRLCLTRAITEGHLWATHCLRHVVDRARYGGRLYSDKAPGMSLLALPVAAVTRLPPPSRWHVDRDAGLWVVRLLVGGAAFAVLVVAIGRVAEGIQRETGRLAATALALGTITGSLAASMFSEVMCATLGTVAFLLAWRGRSLAAGAVAGAALVVEYQSALIVVVLAVYCAFAGRRALARYVLGVTPGAVVLGTYDRVAFGSPFHASYRYVANRFALDQAKGLFGIGLPKLHSAYVVLFADRGLLVVSPVLLAAAAGLIALRHRYPREVVVCFVVVAAYLALEVGYFLPYGGVSPGPRFLVPALPFLVIGLAALHDRARLAVRALMVTSITCSTWVMLTWANRGVGPDPLGAWGRLGRFLVGDDRVDPLSGNVLTYLGAGQDVAAAFVALAAGAALLVATPRRPAVGKENAPGR